MLTELNDLACRSFEKARNFGLGFDVIRNERELSRIEERELNALLHEKRPSDGLVSESQCIQVIRPSLWTTLVLASIGTAIYFVLGMILAVIIIGVFLLVAVPFILPGMFMLRAYGSFDQFVMIGNCPKCNGELRVNIRKNGERDWPKQGFNCPGCMRRIVLKPPYFWIPDDSASD